MPGPGGGSRGGGGGRGFGGGFGGGGGSFGGGGRGFGGGYHHHHYGPRFHGGWFFGPRRYYGGGGCLGGLLGMMMAPIIILLFAGIMLLSVFGSAFGSITTGGEIYYDENTYQDYANQQYAEYFGEFEDYEDGLVIVLAVEDVEYYDYAYIAWLGDNIDYEINLMFGAHGTKFGNAIESSAINSGSYKYSLDSGIAAVMRTMKQHVTALHLENNLTCNHDYQDFDSRLVNKTDIDITPNTVNAALKDFTESTGIPVIVVVEDASEILPQYFDWFSVIVATVLIVIAVVLIVKALKNRPKKQEDDGSYHGSNQNNYNNQNYNNNNYNNSGW